MPKTRPGYIGHYRTGAGSSGSRAAALPDPINIFYLYGPPGVGKTPQRQGDIRKPADVISLLEEDAQFLEVVNATTI